MKKDKALSESSIKQALNDGYITNKEARQMLMLYLQKANFTPMSHLRKHKARVSFSSPR